MGDDFLYKVALGNTPKVGSKLTKTLIAYCGSAEQVFKTTKGKLLKIPGVGEHIANALNSGDSIRKAEDQIKIAEQNGDRLIFFTDEDYPYKLRQIYDAPSLIYFNGNVDLQSKKVLAIVGTRNITSYGKKVLEKLISELSGQDILVISGLAYGVDVYAHRLCLQYNIPTLGVMANGLDKVYPAAHRKVAEEMKQEGGLLTEEPYGTIPVAMKFPARNRVVAGMADATVVVESAIKGGSLITANLAFDYNKEVFAVPGEIGKKFSEGCNQLISDDKAHIYTSTNDLLKELGWTDGVHKKVEKELDLTDFTPEEQAILLLLQKDGEQAIDEITWKLQASPNQLASTLLSLELSNVVDVLPGKKYRINHFNQALG